MIGLTLPQELAATLFVAPNAHFVGVQQAAFCSSWQNATGTYVHGGEYPGILFMARSGL
jgi:hypothetical protein